MYSKKLYIDNRVSFGRFVGSKWNNVNEKIKTVDPNSVTRSSKGQDRFGVFVEVSAETKHFYKVDRSIELLSRWHAQLLNRTRRDADRAARDSHNSSYSDYAKSHTSTVSEPARKNTTFTLQDAIVKTTNQFAQLDAVVRNDEAPAGPQTEPKSFLVGDLVEALWGGNWHKATVVLSPWRHWHTGKGYTVKLDAWAYDMNVRKGHLRPRTTFQTTTAQPTPKVSVTKAVRKPAADSKKLYSASAPSYHGKRNAWLAPPTVSSLPASARTTPCPSVTGAPASSNSSAASVASDAGSLDEECYPTLKAVPAPVTQLATPAAVNVRRSSKHTRRNLAADNRNCKGTFQVLHRGGLYTNLKRIQKECQERFGDTHTPAWTISRSQHSSSVKWSVRGQRSHNYFKSMLQKWYSNKTGLTESDATKNKRRAIPASRWVVGEKGQLFRAPTPPAASQPAQQCNESVEDQEWCTRPNPSDDGWGPLASQPQAPLTSAAPQQQCACSGSVKGDAPQAPREDTDPSWMPWEQTGEIPALELGGSRQRPVAVRPPLKTVPW